MRQTHVPPNVTRSTKLGNRQHFPELAFRSTDFHVPENLIFPALHQNMLFLCYPYIIDLYLTGLYV